MNDSMKKRLALSAAAGVGGALVLSTIYFGLVSWAESPAHAVEQFRADALYVIPILLGFGLQVALYTILRWRLFLPAAHTGASGALAGAGGGTSAAAMVACCAHHVTDVLPLVGLTAATAFLAQYRELFMLVGLLTTLGGSAYMIRLLLTERRMVLEMAQAPMEAS